MNHTKIFILISLLIVLSFSVRAYTPNWKATFELGFEGKTDTFTAGTGEDATDSYDVLIDIIQQGRPPSDSYIQVMTIVDREPLTEEYKTTLEVGEPKTWEIVLVVVDPTFEGLSGTNQLTWSLENTEGIDFTLVDFDNDNTRSDIVGTVNLDEQSSYDFDEDNAMGPYRYLDLIAEKTQSQQNEQPQQTPLEDKTNGEEQEILEKKQEKPEEKPEVEIFQKQIGQEVEEEPLSKVAEVSEVTARQTDIFVGLSITVVIVGVGLSIFYFITRK